jgi:diguanylate cyclase (GGDEF)-like protein
LKVLQSFVHYLEQAPKLLIFVLGLLSVFIISTIDYFVVIDISLSIFYLIPIILTTWIVGKNGGFIISLVSTFGWFFADVNSKNYLYAWLPYWNAGVRLGFFLTISYLLFRFKAAYEKERYLARTDVLTGAVNRRFFLELLELEIKRSHRYKHPLTLAYLDIDDFKMVNDKFGHRTGDELLKLLTVTIQNQIRATDVFSRLGGDEFALLMPETNYQSAQKSLLRLQQQLRQTIQNRAFPVSFSIGAITFIKVPKSVEATLEKADRLMYEVKLRGKNGLEHQLYD